MILTIKAPSLGESVSEATIAKWHKKEGEAVQTDELLVELETEKVTLEVNSPGTGLLGKIIKKEGESVAVGDPIGEVEEGATSKKVAPAQVAVALPTKAPAPETSSKIFHPSAAKLAAENNLTAIDIKGSGREGRITKGDVLDKIGSGSAPVSLKKPEERVRMSRLRKTIAQRLKESQNTAAILTTFNEIDMSAVMALRQKYKEDFEKKHKVKLGFMSFFVKAVVEALKEIPSVNAEIDGEDLVYKNYYDIGVAVGTDQGLVVPVVRNADKLGFAEIENEIAALAAKARQGKLSMSDLSGGTFSISNGGVYGSLLSTPIINPPQSGILGLHKTQERPVALGGKIEVRPMMYAALSYDHRIIDGKEAVTFLVKIKEAIENPERLLIGL